MVEKYPIGIAGPDLNQISREYTGLVASSTNFVLAMLSNSWRAFLDALKESEPALLIVYADIATGPDALKDSPVQAAAGSGDRPAAVQLGAVSGRLRRPGPGAPGLRPAGRPQGSAGCGFERHQHRERPQPLDRPTPANGGGNHHLSGRDTGHRLRLGPGRRRPFDAGRGHGLRTGGPALDPLAALFLRPARRPPPCAWGRALPPAPPNTCSAAKAASRMPSKPPQTGWM